MKQKILFIMMIILVGLVAVGNGQTADTNPRQNDKPLKIKRKPTAQVRDANCSDSSGRVTIRVTFDKSAKITDTLIITSSGCNGFDDNAVRAARQIKFEPAVKNGEPITVTKLIQYDFRRY